jgi:Fur family transcriptional regulator, ferric uptake regulator
MNGSPQLLKEFRLRSTPGRTAILNLFLKNTYALAHADIEKGIASTFDRVTVYRTLKTFLDRGLIHKVLDDEGSLKYALCTEACTHTNHHHDHVHFKCTICGQTNCLDIDVPPIRLPEGYKGSEFNLLIQGKCARCSR